MCDDNGITPAKFAGSLAEKSKFSATGISGVAHRRAVHAQASMEF